MQWIVEDGLKTLECTRVSIADELNKENMLKKASVLWRYIGYDRWSTRKKTYIKCTMTLITLVLLTTVAIVVGSDTYFDTSGRNLVITEYHSIFFSFKITRSENSFTTIFTSWIVVKKSSNLKVKKLTSSN